MIKQIFENIYHQTMLGQLLSGIGSIRN